MLDFRDTRTAESTESAPKAKKAINQRPINRGSRSTACLDTSLTRRPRGLTFSKEKQIKQHCFVGTFVMLMGISAVSDSEPNTNIPVQGYSLFWSDEFNGTTLDTKKWSHRYPGKRKAAVNVEDTVALDGKETWRSDKAVSSTDEYIILSMEVVTRQAAMILKTPGFSDSVYFDYLRVYKKSDQ